MSIQFADGSSTLAPGRHLATADEILDALVDAFPNSTSRVPIYAQWQTLLEAIERMIKVEEQWIDGSFVTKKENPGDIDLVSHVDGPTLEQLGPVDQMLLHGVLAGHQSRDLHLCDSFFIAIYPEGHPARPIYEQALSIWESIFGTDRGGDPKGFVELQRDG